MSSELNKNLESLFGKMENFVSTKTVVGEPVNIGDVIIVPLVDVSFGLGGGFSQNTKDDKSIKENSGSGLGAKITPSAVLVIINGTAQLVNVKHQDAVTKLVDMVPGVVSKLNFGAFNKKSGTGENVKFDDVIITE